MSDVPSVPNVVLSTRDNVRDKLQELQKTGAVKAKLIDRLVDIEIEQRTKLLVDAFNRRDVLFREIDKIRPDQCFFNDRNEEVQRYFSKQKSDELKKSKERLNRLDKAIEKALNEANYDEVKKFIDNSEQEQKRQTEQEK